MREPPIRAEGSGIIHECICMLQHQSTRDPVYSSSVPPQERGPIAGSGASLGGRSEQAAPQRDFLLDVLRAKITPEFSDSYS